MLTCAGRRVYSLEIFKEAVGDRSRVFACDSSADAAALQKADKAFVVPSVDQEDYVDTLLDICNHHQVSLLVPALEPELVLLAMNRARFLAIGTIPLVSSPEITATCFDKLATYDFLSNCGLLVPHTFGSLTAARKALSLGELAFPLVVKPRWGVSSIGTHFPDDDEELELFYRVAKKQIEYGFLGEVSAADLQRSLLIQERLLGEEYGMDVINDLNGDYVCTFIKRKIRMRAGQTDQAVTVRDDRLEMIGQRIGEKLGHIGLLDCDAFTTKHGCYVIDMNPRIGGGYPFSHIAGANLPAALVAWASGQAPNPAWFNIEPDVAASRYDSLLITNRKAPEIVWSNAEQKLQRLSLKA
ncbi:MAG: ATP-grasp domain-containing protein [Verrucomicrobia bacterium]|nr:ATP-grasp domain-containing protein [Verrucomicrobiota bacterium]MBV8279666.1 ATP-grasp domain-containing protein [Verrucomicrobiota bacterium]